LINYHTCKVPHLRFHHKDFLWYPRHKDTPRQFECTRLITVDDVKAALQRLSSFGTLKNKGRKAGTARPLVTNKKLTKTKPENADDCRQEPRMPAGRYMVESAMRATNAGAAARKIVTISRLSLDSEITVLKNI
jgi:hypothetical protein